MMPSAFTPLVRAVLDALGEGVVVLDANGHLVYANQTGRSVIEQLGARAGGNEGELRALLLRQGARVAPLRIGDSTLGEAAYLPEADINSGTLAERERQAISRSRPTPPLLLTVRRPSSLHGHVSVTFARIRSSRTTVPESEPASRPLRDGVDSPGSHPSSCTKPTPE